jgi:hypothetical protein
VFEKPTVGVVAGEPQHRISRVFAAACKLPNHDSYIGSSNARDSENQQENPIGEIHSALESFPDFQIRSDIYSDRLGFLVDRQQPYRRRPDRRRYCEPARMFSKHGDSMLVILVFVVRVKAERDTDSAPGKQPPAYPPSSSETAANVAESPDKPVIVMQHEDIERLLESTI